MSGAISEVEIFFKVNSTLAFSVFILISSTETIVPYVFELIEQLNHIF